MRAMAVLLSNGTSINDTDITEMFEFEKDMAKVYFSYFICIS